jgi:hypothetical protein
VGHTEVVLDADDAEGTLIVPIDVVPFDPSGTSRPRRPQGVGESNGFGGGAGSSGFGSPSAEPAGFGLERR